MSHTSLDWATIRPRRAGYALVWPEDFQRQTTMHPSRQDAKDAYFIQIAWDYLGSCIRDNSREQKIAMGRAIEKYGTDEDGCINYPEGDDHA